MHLNVDGSAQLETWGADEETEQVAGPCVLSRGDRISVYWTELRQWYIGTFQRSRVEPADGGGTQRASQIVYDATGDEAHCTPTQLTYWHCLDDELWQRHSE